MSDERNADSVLFKLDTLTAMQAQTSKGAQDGSQQGAPEAMARLAAGTPQADAGSGLIDLRTLGGKPGPGEEAADASSSGSDLTSSAALSQSSLLSSSGMTHAVPNPHAESTHGSPAPAASRTPLIILSVLALLALAAAVTAIVLRG